MKRRLFNVLAGMSLAAAIVFACLWAIGIEIGISYITDYRPHWHLTHNIFWWKRAIFWVSYGSREVMWQWGLNWWKLIVLSFALPVIWVAKKYQRVPVPGRCRQCGYDLRATPDRCPECGTAVKSST